MVGGASAGGLSEAGHAPRLHDALLDEVRAEVPEKSSALLLLAAPSTSTRWSRRSRAATGELVRHQLSPEAARALEDAVAGRPAVA